MANNGGTMALSVLLRAVDQFSGPVKQIETRLSAFGRVAKAVGANAGFERLTASLKRAGSAAKALYTAAGRVARRLALAGVAGVAGIFRTAMVTAALGDNVAKTADKLGVGIERLQEMRFAADRAGVSQQSFDNSLQAFTRRLSEAAKGSGEAAGALDELGLSAEELANTSPDQAMSAVADALSKVENQSDRVRLAFNLFGREGISMVNMLKDGSSGLEQMYTRARELGLVLGKDTARTAEVFTDRMTDMKAAMLGIRNTIGSAVMPIISQWMGQLTDLIVRYQPQIQAWAQNFAVALPERLMMLKAEFFALIDALQPIISIGASMVERFGAVKLAAGALGLIIGAPLIVPLLALVPALAGVAVAVAGFVATLIPALASMTVALIGFAIANPILLGIVLVVAAIAAAAYLLINNWDSIAAFFQNLWNTVLIYVSDAMSSLIDWLGFDPVAVISSLWDGLINYVSNVMGAVVRLFTGDWTAVKDLFKWSPLGLIQTGIDAALDFLSKIDWQAAVAAGWDLLKSIFKWSPLGLLTTAFTQASDFLLNIDWSGHGRALLNTLTEGIKSMAGAPVEALRNTLSRVRNLLPFSDAKEGPLSQLTASGYAIPNTLAEGLNAGKGAFINTVTDVAGAAKDVLSGDWNGVTSWDTSGEEQTGEVVEREAYKPQLNQVASAGSTSSPIHVDFRPSVTIQVSDSSNARDIADLVDERLERMRRNDLWVQVQRVQEAAG